MAVYKPIPKRFLPHVADYYEFTGNAGPRNGSSKYKEKQTVRWTRIIPGDSLKMNNSTEGTAFNYMLFWDVVNTTPKCEPIIKSNVIWQGKELVIVGVEALYTDTKLHHYEVKLKG